MVRKEIDKGGARIQLAENTAQRCSILAEMYLLFFIVGLHWPPDLGHEAFGVFNRYFLLVPWRLRCCRFSWASSPRQAAAVVVMAYQ